MRWDDDNYEFPASDTLSVMNKPPLHDGHGFVLHDVCWGLLQKAFGPGEVPLKRLLEICRSLPFPSGHLGLGWSHDYGGLFKIDTQEYFPWEEHYIRTSNCGMTDSCALTDPSEESGVSAMSTKWSKHTKHPSEWAPKRPGVDCFSRLPWHILEAIAVELVTRDVLNLRFASICFQPIFFFRALFWASRFRPDGELGFLFEKLNIRKTTGWLNLYRFLNSASCPLILRNRRRIWELIRPLVNSVKTRLVKMSGDLLCMPEARL